MTGHIRIITPNAADIATLSVSPAAAATLPVTNLQDQTRTRVWRSTSIAQQVISFNWSSGVSLSAFSLVRHNLSPSATIRLRIWNSENQTGTVLYDSGTVALGTSLPWGIFVWGVDPWGGGNIFSGWAYSFTTLWFATVIAARSGSLVIDDAGNAEGYIQASRLFLGPYFSPSINAGDGGLKIGWAESSNQQRTDGGSLRTDGILPNRRISFRLAHLPEVERIQLFEIARVVGLRRDFFLSIFPEDGTATERDFAGQMKFVDPLPEFTYARTSGTPVYLSDLVAEEA